MADVVNIAQARVEIVIVRLFFFYKGLPVIAQPADFGNIVNGVQGLDLKTFEWSGVHVILVEADGQYRHRYIVEFVRAGACEQTFRKIQFRLDASASVYIDLTPD